jgi:hypothetical protein
MATLSEEAEELVLAADRIAERRHSDFRRGALSHVGKGTPHIDAELDCDDGSR